LRADRRRARRAHEREGARRRPADRRARDRRAARRRLPAGRPRLDVRRRPARRRRRAGGVRRAVGSRPARVRPRAGGAAARGPARAARRERGARAGPDGRVRHGRRACARAPRTAGRAADPQRDRTEHCAHAAAADRDRRGDRRRACPNRPAARRRHRVTFPPVMTESDRTEVHRIAAAPARTASYEADPDEVKRVLLLYSGGLDTSVMLKWIQDEYGAEVVCLTVNLGQPGEDYDVVKGKALQLGAVDCHVVDAREQFAQEFLVPAIKANALYGNGYPLFTALGRPLIAQLAVEYARSSGCDTIAHGCTGKGNDQVRIETTIATLAPELKVIAPVRSWQMGREEEIAYAREHGIPVKGGTEVAPYSIDDNLWGRSSEGRWIEDLGHAPDDDVFQLV